eukprot:TRINITY_DN83250_c0_g1_i1.p1 TRINITY_DN83250_c0_g1~~TRINITY_DN83250_c0_g1_i1.p1  ORF type:complete len:101 (-),score=5.26 TRINITY_DN83250_c0_g1_i1:111-392(-)
MSDTRMPVNEQVQPADARMLDVYLVCRTSAPRENVRERIQNGALPTSRSVHRSVSQSVSGKVGQGGVLRRRREQGRVERAQQVLCSGPQAGVP